jgi:spore coat protein U-like protein
MRLPVLIKINSCGWLLLSIAENCILKKRKKIMKMNLKQNSVKLAIAAGLVVGSVSVTMPAFASTKSTDLEVKASIGTACVVSTDALDFGTYDPNAAEDLTGTGKINTTCTSGASGTIKIGKGTNGTGDDDTPTRRMLHASEAEKYLSYDVFTNDGRTLQWNHTAIGDADLNGTGSEVSLTVYGKITKGQTGAIAGDYADTLLVTINY